MQISGINKGYIWDPMQISGINKGYIWEKSNNCI
jgi:hypothetical protein